MVYILPKIDNFLPPKFVIWIKNFSKKKKQMCWFTFLFDKTNYNFCLRVFQCFFTEIFTMYLLASVFLPLYSKATFLLKVKKSQISNISCRFLVCFLIASDRVYTVYSGCDLVCVTNELSTRMHAMVCALYSQPEHYIIIGIWSMMSKNTTHIAHTQNQHADEFCNLTEFTVELSCRPHYSPVLKHNIQLRFPEHHNNTQHHTRCNRILFIIGKKIGRFNTGEKCSQLTFEWSRFSLANFILHKTIQITFHIHMHIFMNDFDGSRAYGGFG